MGLLFPVLCVLVLLVWWRWANVPATDKVPQRAIVVDGSNVMHWGGAPSAKVLNRVLRGLEAEGLKPIVFFDANVGYLLEDGYLDAAEMARVAGLPEARVNVVDKGTVADEALLRYAARHGLRVVSNDRFQDWRTAYPHLRKKGSVLRGSFRDGAVVWKGTL